MRYFRLLLAKLIALVVDVLLLLAGGGHLLTIWLMPKDIRERFEKEKKHVH